MADHNAGKELDAIWANIAQAAYEVAVAEVEDDDQGASDARERSAQAVADAIRMGQPFTAIAARESEGRRRATDELGKRLLKAATASARRREEAQAAYERDVRRAARLLSDREVAQAINVAPGTVRAITRRPEAAETTHGTEPDNGDLTEAENADSDQHAGA